MLELLRTPHVCFAPLACHAERDFAVPLHARLLAVTEPPGRRGGRSPRAALPAGDQPLQEGSSRRLAQHCGLPWHDAMLRFYETDRTVQTASQLQVRCTQAQRGPHAAAAPQLGPRAPRLRAASSAMQA